MTNIMIYWITEHIFYVLFLDVLANKYKIAFWLNIGMLKKFFLSSCIKVKQKKNKFAE